jgi:hypothetical protein
LLALIGFVFAPAIAVAIASPSRTSSNGDQLIPAGFDLSALLLLAGVILLTRPEGYPPADRQDRQLRKTLRLFATIPLLMCFLLHLQIEMLLFTVRRLAFWFRQAYLDNQLAVWLLWTSLALLVSFLPLLLFLHLRGLARRARSPHLAEHCLIVGIGASAAAIYASVFLFVINNIDSVGLDSRWLSRSPVSLALMLLLGTAGYLFVLWSVYLLIRFAIAFWLASRNLNKKWKRDDRSVSMDN